MGLFIPRSPMSNGGLDRVVAGSRLDPDHPWAQGCVGAWFAGTDGGGNVWHDISGYGNHGTLVGIDPATGWMAGKDGWELSGFDGNGTDYVSLGYTPKSLYVSDGLTILSWARCSTNIGSSWAETLFSPEASRCFLCAPAGVVQLWIFNGTWSNSSSSKAIRDNSWHHIGGTWDNANIQSYIDGLASGPPTPKVGPIYCGSTYIANIGQYAPGAYVDKGWNGGLASVMMWTRALSPDTIAELYSQPSAMIWTPGRRRTFHLGGITTPVRTKLVGKVSSGPRWLPPGQKPQVGQQVDWEAWNLPRPVGEWWFNEGTGDRVFDASGNGNDGALTNGGPIWTPSEHGTALAFTTASKHHVVVSRYITGLTQFTLAGWVYKTALGISTIIGQCDSVPSGQSLTFYLRISGTSGFYRPDGFYQIDIPEMSLNTWHHAALTYDGTALSYLLDGALTVGPTAANGVPMTTGPTLSIGRLGAYDGQYWPGMMEGVQIFPTALSQTQVNALQGPIPIRGRRSLFFIPPHPSFSGSGLVHNPSTQELLTYADSILTQGYEVGASSSMIYDRTTQRLLVRDSSDADVIGFKVED